MADVDGAKTRKKARKKLKAPRDEARARSVESRPEEKSDPIAQPVSASKCHVRRLGLTQGIVWVAVMLDSGQ